MCEPDNRVLSQDGSCRSSILLNGDLSLTAVTVPDPTMDRDVETLYRIVSCEPFMSLMDRHQIPIESLVIPVPEFTYKSRESALHLPPAPLFNRRIFALNSNSTLITLKNTENELKDSF
jgi:hypothetical protein